MDWEQLINVINGFRDNGWSVSELRVFRSVNQESSEDGWMKYRPGNRITIMIDLDTKEAKHEK